MGVQKASSNKNMKKSSKLDSLKNLVLGNSNSASKKASATSERPASEKSHHSSQANHATGQKKGSAQPQASKAQGKAASHSSKASGKSKANSGPNSGHAQKAANKSSTAHTLSKASSPKAAPATKQTKTAGQSVRKAEQSLRKVEHGHARLELAGETVCREVACEGLATSGGYCRLHYIKNWKKIKRKELILREKKLNQYIEELVAKYPDKYIEAIRQDLASDKDFAKVIYDLDLDEGVDDFDIEGSESVDSLIDTIKREFDDEGETF